MLRDRDNPLLALPEINLRIVREISPRQTSAPVPTTSRTIAPGNPAISRDSLIVLLSRANLPIAPDSQTRLNPAIVLRKRTNRITDRDNRTTVPRKRTNQIVGRRRIVRQPRNPTVLSRVSQAIGRPRLSRIIVPRSRKTGRLRLSPTTARNRLRPKIIGPHPHPPGTSLLRGSRRLRPVSVRNNNACLLPQPRGRRRHLNTSSRNRNHNNKKRRRNRNRSHQASRSREFASGSSSTLSFSQGAFLFLEITWRDLQRRVPHVLRPLRDVGVVADSNSVIPSGARRGAPRAVARSRGIPDTLQNPRWGSRCRGANETSEYVWTSPQVVRSWPSLEVASSFASGRERPSKA